MSIFQQIFGKQQPQQPAASQQQQQAQNGQQHVNNNPTVPNQSNQMPPNNAAQPGDESPTDKFKDLWQNTPNASADNTPNFRLNPETLAQHTQKMDFTRSVNGDDLQKIAAGGQEAVDALKNILNGVGRDIFSNTAQFSSHMTESGYRVAQQSIDKGLPDIVRRQMSSQELYQANPKLRDPAMQPLVSAIQMQISQKYPNATPAEVNGMVSEYLGSVVAPAFSKEDPAQAQNKVNPATDFTNFLQ